MTPVVDKRRFKQGDRTGGKLEVEVTLKFEVRPAGYAGNDGMSVARIVHVFTGFAKYMLLGDERVAWSARWRRPDERRWRTYEEEL